MRLRLYLDTSVLNLRFDESSPERNKLTREFFDRASEFALSTSEAAVMEIQRTADSNRRRLMLEFLETMNVIPISDEMNKVVEAYMTAGIFTRGMQMDALHVAAAVISDQDILLSWNFKHLVNRRRRGLINLTNASLGLPSIEILSPPEI